MNNHEASRLTFILTLPLFLGIGITRLVSIAHQDIWLSIIIGTLIGTFINFLFTALPPKENRYFIMLYSFILLVIGLTSITQMTSKIYLNNTPLLLIIIPLLILIYYLTQKKEKTIYYVTNLLFIATGTLMIISLIGIIPHFNFNHFLPVYQCNLRYLLMGSLNYALISTTPFVLLPNHRQQYKLKNYLIASLFVLFLLGGMIAVLGYPLASSYAYPEYVLLKRITLFAGFEKILLLGWFFTFFPLLALAGINLKKNTNQLTVGILLIIALIITMTPWLTDLINLYFSHLLLSCVLLAFLGKLIK